MCDGAQEMTSFDAINIPVGTVIMYIMIITDWGHNL